MGNARKERRARRFEAPTTNQANGLDISEIIRRLNFLKQMRPKNRNKPRNVKKMANLRAALVRA